MIDQNFTQFTNKSMSDKSDDDVVQVLQQMWIKNMQHAPEVESYIDAIDPYVCSKAELIHAMRMSLEHGIAPVGLALHEIMMFRLTAAAITGNAFL